MTAVGLLCRIFLGQKPEENPVMAKHAELIKSKPPVYDPDGFGSDLYSWYYGTYALFQMGGAQAAHWGLIKGERIPNPLVTEFIGRNYAHDGDGRWFFQNGPQRVFVAVAYTPLVYRVASGAGEPLSLVCHTGKPVLTITGAWLDEQGVLLIESEHGAGIVHDRDLDRLLPCLSGADGRPPDEPALAGLMEQLQQQREAPRP